jgi:hypothetical protein
LKKGIKEMGGKGVALISVLAITAIALVVISTTTFISIVNSRMGLDRLHSQKAYQGADALIEESILRFTRWRGFSNPYSDWTSDCLQIKDFECKMEINLGQDGGTVDAWGKVANKIRHLQLELEVLEDESVSISARREIY